MIVLQTEIDSRHSTHVQIALPKELQKGKYQAVLVLSPIKDEEEGEEEFPSSSSYNPLPQSSAAEANSSVKIPAEDHIFLQREMQNLGEGIDPFKDFYS